MLIPHNKRQLDPAGFDKCPCGILIQNRASWHELRIKRDGGGDVRHDLRDVIKSPFHTGFYSFTFELHLPHRTIGR